MTRSMYVNFSAVVKDKLSNIFCEDSQILSFLSILTYVFTRVKSNLLNSWYFGNNKSQLITDWRTDPKCTVMKNFVTKFFSSNVIPILNMINFLMNNYPDKSLFFYILGTMACNKLQFLYNKDWQTYTDGHTDIWTDPNCIVN